LKHRRPGICFGGAQKPDTNPISLHAPLHDDHLGQRSDERTERRMTQCRMCSQRLTGPGRLCRECERELDRARFADASVDAPAAAVPLIDASRTAGTDDGAGRFGRRHSRGSVIVAAFTVGLVGAIALHLAQRSNAAPGSVMLDRDISGLHARSFMPASVHPSENAGANPPSNTLASVAALTESHTQTSSGDDHSRPPPPHRVTLPVKSTSTADDSRGHPVAHERSAATVRDAQPAAVAVATDVSGEPSAGYDRVLGFSDALARCGDATFFARIACEERARMRYCDGAASQLPQCAEEFPRDHGQ
jgi:hypothetical protein